MIIYYVTSKMYFFCIAFISIRVFFFNVYNAMFIEWDLTLDALNCHVNHNK